MKRFVCLIFISLFIGHAMAAPPKLENDKRIVRWSSEFNHPRTKEKLLIVASILDPETNPVLMEFTYSLGDGIQSKRISMTYIKEFRFVSNSQKRDFKIKFNTDFLINNNELVDFYPYLPKTLVLSLGSSILDLTSIMSIASESPLLGETPLSAKTEWIAIEDFTPISEHGNNYVLEAGKPALYQKQYFADRGIEFPSITNKSKTSTLAQSESNGRITRWTAEFPHPYTRKKMFIVASVTDPFTNPKLSEFIYTIVSGHDEIKINSKDIKDFELVTDKPGNFRIKFNNQSFLDPDSGRVKSYYEVFQHYLPEALTFGYDFESFNLEPARVLGITTTLLIALPKREQIHIGEFVQSRKSSAVMNIPAAPKAEDRKRITRWSLDIDDPGNPNDKKIIVVSVFDAETNPALIEMAYRSGVVPRYLQDVIKFEQTPDQPGHFKIQFEDRASYYETDGTLTSFYNRLDVPRSISFNIKDKKFYLETISDNNSNIKNTATLAAKIEQLAPSDFKLDSLHNIQQVLEPSTIHKLSYNQYFGAKGIRFPHIQSSSSSRRDSSSQQSSAPIVSSASDLRLGDLLKDKKTEVLNLPRFPGHKNMWYKPLGEGNIYGKKEIHKRV